MYRFAQRFISPVIFAAFSLAAFAAHAADDKLVVYSARKEAADKPLFEAFTKATGIPVEALHDEAPKLLARLQSEGKDTPGDILLVVDSTNLNNASQKGFLQPVKSATLEKIIPAAYRDPENKWFGFAKRVRAIVYNKEKVKPSELSTYENLADPKWKGQLLVRTSNSAYNQSLISAMIATHGVEGAQGWANGIAANLARKPQGGDIDQIKAVAAGEGLIGISNSYYYARMLNSKLPEEKEAAEKVGIFFPNQKAKKGEMTGAHINVSGGGVITGSKHETAAVKFLEFLTTDEGQHIYADANYEFPVNPKIKPVETVQAFGNFKPDAASPSILGQYAQDAVRVADKSGWK